MISRKIAVLMFGLALTGQAGAADVMSPVTPGMTTTTANGWTFAVAPYFWATGLDGHVAEFGSPVVKVNESFSDILADLDFGAMVISEARYGPWSIFNDLMYSKVSTSASTPFGVLATNVELTTKTFAGLLGGGYSVIDNDQGHLDVVAGARVWDVDTGLAFEGGILDGAAFSDGDTWVDGLVGVRGAVNFTPKFYATGWGLVGAGGADIDWDVAAGLGYHFNDTFSGIVGYRALGVDYSNDDGFLFDIVQSGPILGVVARF